tara:strand:+ start:1925 stop:3100 length:1176 start_codon:yes stop_codon:yes gene_type:complete
VNKSPLIFVGVLFALSLSWWGMVYGPASQVNNLSPELGAGDPLRPRVGLAKQGEQVYRENGCYYCHTRAATGGSFGYEIQITQLGDDRQLNAEAVDQHDKKYSRETVFQKAYSYKAVAKAADALKQEQDKEPEERDQKKIQDANATLISAIGLSNDISRGAEEGVNLKAYGVSGVSFEKDLLAQLGLPAEMNANQARLVKEASFPVTDGSQSWKDIEGTIQTLKDKAGAQYKLQPVAKEWPDVQKGAGRQSVSRDFLFDEHVMIGVMRFGPDLSNIGRNILFEEKNGKEVANNPEEQVIEDNKIYKHLYDPQWNGQSSHMPPFRYLFKERKLGENERVQSGEIEVEKEDSYRVAITPTAKARALLAYMKSLRNDKPLPEAPLVRRKQASAK